MISSFSLTWLKLQRLMHRSHNPLLKKCWRQESIRRSDHWRHVEFLAVDIETSSLDANQGELLSIGWVVISQGTIDISSAVHTLVRSKRSVGNSAAIHQLRDCELAIGVTPEQAMTELIEAATNRLLVFHHSALDMLYLNQLCRQQCGAPLLLPVVDTMTLERRKLERRSDALAQGALRLGTCRKRYNLPDYPAHNALIDALATAELLLAHIQTKGDNVKIKDLF